ncbi:hypothetical protein HUO13_16350 [Saccharopolyspora erythraea]|uniref:maltokinase N-terminal cap-like domain-containing protein n=1 Tax=Saccharopolyspora erythraea TaxID=1836 RepID=UPI001BA9A6C9|nr:aminoglycoside phosphotransferase [Saccharopolyspora erythraea]QUH02154.1 hypothetical protein HUO13_16350 [Saccharopolyspora erythraea]
MNTPMRGPAAADLHRQIATWLPAQPWFADKNRRIDEVGIVRAVALDSGTGPRAVLSVIRLTFDDGGRDYYQVPLGFRSTVPPALGSAVLGESDGSVVYDALADPELVRRLVAAFAAERGPGSMRFRLTADARGLEPGRGGVRAVAQEQSNSSVVVDERLVLKVFRRLVPGINPDVELNRALVAAHNAHVPVLRGFMDTDVGGVTTSMMTLQEFVPCSTTGWDMALHDLAGELEGRDFSAFPAAAVEVGVAVARVHRDLARSFGTSPFEQKHSIRQLNSTLDSALPLSPRLAEHEAALRETVLSLGEEIVRTPQIPSQRVHGDLHLGQVLHSLRGWLVLDFEGEPDRSLASRLLPASPLRDVAGMLRSFDYAADRTALARQAGEGPRAWAERARSAFLDGYAEAAGFDPREQRALLDAYVLDKALYETAYEVRHRPSWSEIPIRGVLRLLEESDAG